MTDWSEDLRSGLPAFVGAALGRLDDPDGIRWIDGDAALQDAAQPLITMLEAWQQAYSALGGRVDVGSEDEVLISASRLYLLARVDHRTRHFVLVGLGSEGNVAYLRYRLRGLLKRFVQEST